MASENSVWAVLLPVLVGGILTLVGSTIGPIVQAWRSDRAETATRRREHLEQIFAFLHEHEHWLDQKRNFVVFGDGSDPGPNPLWKAISISELHIPALRPAVFSLQRTAKVYEVWMLGRGRARLAGHIDQLSDGHSQAYEPYLEAISFARSEIGRVASNQSETRS